MSQSPVFDHLFELYQRLSDAERESSEGRVLFGELIIHAPPEHKRIIDEVAKKMDLMPDRPHGYDDDGNPLYSLEQIAERLGVAPEEIDKSIREFAQARDSMGLPPLNIYAGTVHRVQ
jgi:hypothetical protein